MKKCVEFSLASFGNLKYDCVIKTRKMFNFLSLINSSVTIGLSFSLLIVSTIISSKAVNILRLLFRLDFSIFFIKHLSYDLSTQ